MLSFLKKNKPLLTTKFPKGFVDIHNHLIPGIDDGAKTLEDSLTLIKRIHNYGIENIICTPHIMEGVWENTPEIILNQLEKLQIHLNENNLSNITISAAAEYMLDGNFN